MGYPLPMATRSAKAGAAPPDPAKLKRESAGRYATGDGRFTAEQSSGGWMVVDGEQSDELGLPLVRGPFSTLDEARAAMAAARRGPAPISQPRRAECGAAQAVPPAGNGTGPAEG